MKTKLTILGIFLSFGISLESNGQCMTLNVPLDNRISGSDVIVEGTVISSEPFWNEKRDFIYTSNMIQVSKIFKGTVSTENIEVITQGGIIDDTWIKVEPNLEINVGDIGVFLFNGTNGNVSAASRYNNSLNPTALSLGLIKYDLNDLSASDMFTRYADIKKDLYDRITQQTGAAYIDLHKFDLSAHKRAASLKVPLATITSFSPTTVSAGSQTVLTINGTGFGATRGTNSVGFYNSNNGGSTWVDVNDNSTTADDFYYTLWSDTKIQILVPHRNSTTGTSFFAGTGPISVNVGGRAISSGSLYVKWCRYEAQSVDGVVSSHLANINGTGGYTWQMNTAFAANTAAAAAFQRAMDTWSCGTKINWKMGANTTIAANADDGTNVIRLPNSGELANNILASTATTYRLFCGATTTRRWYLLGFDMVVNNIPILGQYSWQYGPALANSNQYDMETVMVHELGHAMQHGHIIKPGFIMNYSISNGENTRVIHSEVLEGGNAITASSFATQTCTGPAPDGGAMIPYTPASCAAAGIGENSKNTGIEIFPVPANNSLTVVISPSSGESVQQVSLFDQLGKEVYFKDFKNSGVTSSQINTENISEGVYFVRVTTTANVLAQKIIIAR